MDESIAVLLFLFFLAIPVVIIILLIVFIVKTNRIAGENIRIQAELARLSRQLERIVRESSRPSATPAAGAPAPSWAEPGEQRTPTEPGPLQPLPPPAVEARPPEIIGPRLSVTEPAQPPAPGPGELPVERAEDIRAPLTRPVGEARPEQPVVPPPTGAPSVSAQPAGPPFHPGERQSPLPAYQSLPRIPIPEQPPSRTRAEWEALIGGRLLNWIGAIAIIIGVGFFLWYGFQNHWISPSILVFIGGAVGILLLVQGRRSYNKGYKIFCQGLIGAGISILYLSAYSSFNLFHLLSQKSAFGLMSAVTVVAFFQAFSYDSLAVSILGWAGGFLTPFLLSTGQNNEVGLFTYIALLVAGLLAVVARKNDWSILAPMTLGATYLVYLLWYNKFYSPTDALTTLAFLTVFWLLFLALDVIGIVRPQQHLFELREMTAVFNAVFYYTAVYVIVDPTYHDSLYLVTLGIGAVYFLAIVGSRTFKPSKLTLNRFHITAFILLAVATAVHFTGFWIVFYWALEAAIVVACAGYFEAEPIQVTGLLLLGVCIVKLLLFDLQSQSVPAKDFVFIFNARSAAFLMLAAAFASSSVALRRFARERLRQALVILNFAWPLVLGVWLAVETNSEFEHLIANSSSSVSRLDFERFLAIGVIFAAYSLALIWLGLKREILHWIISGLAALGVSASALLARAFEFEPIQSFTLILNLRTGAIVFVIVTAAFAAYLLNNRTDWRVWFRSTAGVLLVLSSSLLLGLCTAETNDWFRLARLNLPGHSDELYFRELMVLVIVWTVFAAAMIWLGLKRRLIPPTAVGTLAAVGAITTVCTQGFTYLPIQDFSLLINLRTLAFLCVVAGIEIIAAWVRGSGFNWAKDFEGPARVVTALLVVLLLSVETRDYFLQHLFMLRHPLGLDGPPADWPTILREFRRWQNLEQMALSLVWLAYSIILIAYGIWKRVLSLRLVAIVLFGATILKIFIYDLSFLETLYRIFSFIALGLILLTVSYLYQRFKSVIFETGTGEKAEA